MIGYVRVSTQEQADSGLGLDAQREAIYRWALMHGHTMAKPMICEDCGSGKAMDNRPALGAALSMLARREHDTLIVAKLDRLGRSLLDLATILEASRKQGWRLVALDIGLDTSTPTGEAMFGMMAVWAQLERRMISQRTRDALAAAKLRGTKSGKPVGRPQSIDGETQELIRFRRREGWSYRKIGDAVGLGWTSARRVCQRA